MATTPPLSHPVTVVDSHTGGEPTRVVVAGGPDLGGGSMAERREIFRARHDGFRRAVINEPRGSDILIGALLCEPVDPSCAAGVIFFNNVGVLNMCGHGTIGVAVTLAHLGRIEPGTHRLETPVGTVSIDFLGGASVAFENVPSYRHRKDVTIDVEGHGPVTGDIVWGGNWFFLANHPGEELAPANIGRLTDFTIGIRNALEREAISGENGGLIDHIELSGPSGDPNVDSRNFVLCPGHAYDRSPCGTGTSAKIACLIEDGKLAPGDTWRQQSIIGSVFEASGRIDDEGRIIPRIQGEAFVTADATLLFHPGDPFKEGTLS